MPSLFQDNSFLVGTGVSIVFLLIALLFMLKLSTFIALIRFPMVPGFFLLESLYYAVMIHLLMFALATWLYSSNFHDTRYQSRIFMALVLFVYFVLIIFVSSSVSPIFDTEKPMLFDKDIWEDSSNLPAGIGMEVYLLLICAVIMIGYVIWNKKKPPAVPQFPKPRVKPGEKPHRRARKQFK